MLQVAGGQFVVYVDSGYSRHSFVETNYEGSNLTPLEDSFNTQILKAWMDGL